MNTEFFKVIDELKVTQYELLATINNVSKNRVAAYTKNGKTRLGISRTTLYNFAYNDSKLSERSASLVLQAVNTLSKNRNGGKKYLYEDIGIYRTRYTGW